MDDLNGLDWSATPSATSAVPRATGNYYSSAPSLQTQSKSPPPLQNSGRNTPLSIQGSGFARAGIAAAGTGSKTAADSFSNLVSFGSKKAGGTLTLQEQQEKLQEERKKAEEQRRKEYEVHFGGSQFDRLGGGSTGFGGTPSPFDKPGGARNGFGGTGTSQANSRNSTPALKPSPAPSSGRAASPLGVGGGSNAGDDDLFAAFSKEAPVDKSSYYPPPSLPGSGRNTPGFMTLNSGTSTPALAAPKPVDLSNPTAWEQSGSGSLGGELGDDDDPFGLAQMQAQISTPAPVLPADEDDFLGDLGKPVEEVRRASPPKRETSAPTPAEDSDEGGDDPWDIALAELVDMGFSAEQSRRALTESGSGLDIQAAVGWILEDAHRQAKQKQQSGSRPQSQNASASNGKRREAREPREGSQRRDNSAWMREEGSERSQPPRREDNRSPSEADLSKQAAAMGGAFLKTANSFWKTTQKKAQKAVAEFQQDSDPGQPKWMREAAERDQDERRQAANLSRKLKAAPEVTDEALMLEGGGRPQPRKAKALEPRFPPSNSSRDLSPSMPKPSSERASPAPRWQQVAPPRQEMRTRVNKQAIEEESAQAYVSSARRRKPTAQPTPQPEVDLFNSPAPSKPSQPPRTIHRPSPVSSKPSPVPIKSSSPIPTRPKAPTRQIPTLSPTALEISNQHRLAGAAHFKRGDYAAAHASYSSSLSALPAQHPITIILLCNRALTSLKTGIPKSAVSDADTAITLIGTSRGDNESIDLGPGEGCGSKEMKEFYGKALMRKAEALEQMEQWKKAGDVWRLCVEHGVGGPTAIQGRSRCEKALAPKPKPTPRTTSAPRPKAASALSDLGPSGQDSAAVKRLREANQQAERADDEKFALSEQVEVRIGAWRDGKRDNLRALIGSLDNVMWEGAGWKKVGMHELITNGKVKINYMKAIGKTHPDKLPQDASTEIRMIASLVFATLNESWDSFKKQNGM